jgi:hypothetical protein
METSINVVQQHQTTNQQRKKSYPAGLGRETSIPLNWRKLKASRKQPSIIGEHQKHHFSALAALGT